MSQTNTDKKPLTPEQIQAAKAADKDKQKSISNNQTVKK